MLTEVKEAGRMIWMFKFAEGDRLSSRRWKGCRVEDQCVAGRETGFIHLAVKNKWFCSTVPYTSALVSGGGSCPWQRAALSVIEDICCVMLMWRCCSHGPEANKYVLVQWK